MSFLAVARTSSVAGANSPDSQIYSIPSSVIEERIFIDRGRWLRHLGSSSAGKLAERLESSSAKFRTNGLAETALMNRRTVMRCIVGSLRMLDC